MAMSLNKNLLDVTKQNTEKLVIQDWLDGNNFSQTSCGFEPLVVHADVHCSAAGVGWCDINGGSINNNKDVISSVKPLHKNNNYKYKAAGLSVTEYENIIKKNPIVLAKRLDITAKQEKSNRVLSAISKNNDVVQQAINSKLNNKGTLKRKIKTTTTTLHQNCGNLIKKLSDDLVKRIPIVLVRPLKIHDNKTQIIKGEGISKRTKLSVWKGSSNERNNKACTNSLDKKRVTRKDNLNLTVCTSKEEKSLLVTPIKVSEQTSPGRSRFERTKKDFNTAQKNRLDVSIGNKLLRSITKLDTSRSSCQDDKTEKSPKIKSRKIVKHLFEKGKQEQRNGGNKFNLQQKGNDFNSPVTNNEALQFKIEEKKRPTSKRKSCDAISDSSVYKQVQSLESNSKRRKSCAENVDSLTPADNITRLRTPEEQKVLKSASTVKANSSANVGVQTCSDMHMTYVLSIMQNYLQNKGNKKCTSPEAAGSEPLFCDSNVLTSTLEVSDVATDKAKDSDFILPSCKSVRSLQNRNASSSFIGNNCTDETYFEAVDNITNLSNYKEIGTNLGSANDTEKEHPVVSQDSHFDNESMMSLSTVKLHELSNPSSETDLDYDVVVSSSATETNSINKTFLESAVCSGNMLGICTVKEVKRKSVDFEKTLSESIQRMDELTNEACDSIKVWIQQNQTYAATNFTQFTNTVNTEVLDTQQQKHLGEECIQSEAEIKAMQEEPSRKIQH